MIWRAIGLLSSFVFAALGVMALRKADPVLWATVYLAAALTGVRLTRGREVPRWLLLTLVLAPSELAATSLWTDEALAIHDLDADGPLSVRSSRARDALRMIGVAGWSMVLLAARPFRDESDEAQPGLSTSQGDAPHA